MSNRIVSGALLALLSFAACDGAAAAATIDTFEFTDSTNWFRHNPATGEDSPLGLTITGSFTGQVEPSGVIEQADLSNFTASVTAPSAVASLTSSSLMLFSYNPTNGPTSLDMIAALPAPPFLANVSICLGAAATLSPSCNFFGLSPVNARGVIVVDKGILGAFTTDFPVITLVSSRSTVPEAPTWAMMLLGFAGLALAGYRATRKTAAAA